MPKKRGCFIRGGTALLTILVGVVAALGAAWDAGDRKAPREVVLTQNAPQAVFPLDEQRVNNGETTVVIRLVRQDNPEHADFSVSLVLAGCQGGEGSQVVPIGSLGTYPVGKGDGSYAFDIGPALKQMRGSGRKAGQVCMRVELKALRASATWKRLRVTVTSPEWSRPPAN